MLVSLDPLAVSETIDPGAAENRRTIPGHLNTFSVMPVAPVATLVNPTGHID